MVDTHLLPNYLINSHDDTNTILLPYLALLNLVLCHRFSGPGTFTLYTAVLPRLQVLSFILCAFLLWLPLVFDSSCQWLGRLGSGYPELPEALTFLYILGCVANLLIFFSWPRSCEWLELILWYAALAGHQACIRQSSWMQYIDGCGLFMIARLLTYWMHADWPRVCSDDDLVTRCLLDGLYLWYYIHAINHMAWGAATVTELVP